MSAPEDVELTETGAQLHSMVGFFEHPDGRTCGKHTRLRRWIVLTDPAHVANMMDLPETYACLRWHEPSVDGGLSSEALSTEVLL